MRLRQVHRAGPFAGGQLGQPFLLLRVRAVGVDRGVGTVGQALVHVEGHVGRGQDLAHRGVHKVGQALATVFCIAIQCRPAAIADLIESRLEPGRRADDAVLQNAAFAVADNVEGMQNFGRHTPGFLQHGTGEVAVDLVIAGDVLRRSLQNIVQHELHVLGGCDIAGHFRSSSNRRGRLCAPVGRGQPNFRGCT